MNNQLRFYLHTDNLLYKILFKYDNLTEKYDLIVKNTKNNKVKIFNKQIKFPEKINSEEIINNFSNNQLISQFEEVTYKSLIQINI